MTYTIKKKDQESQFKKKPYPEKSVINSLNCFIENNKKKFNYVSKNETRLREKKEVCRSHYVGYDPEDE